MTPLPLQVGVELTTRTLTLAGVAAVAVLVGLSGFFSSSEIALFSLADHEVESMASEGLAGANRVAALKADPHRLLVTILVGNNVVNIGMASISTAVLALFDVLTRQVNRLTGTTGAIEAPYVTRTELQQLIETSEREGVIEAGERELLLGVLEFRNRIATEILQPASTWSSTTPSGWWSSGWTTPACASSA